MYKIPDSFPPKYMDILAVQGFPGGSDDTESARSAGDPVSILGLGRFSGEENGKLLKYSCLENSHGQRSLVGYSPWGHKESDRTERLSTSGVLKFSHTNPM